MEDDVGCCCFLRCKCEAIFCSEFCGVADARAEGGGGGERRSTEETEQALDVDVFDEAVEGDETAEEDALVAVLFVLALALLLRCKNPLAFLRNDAVREGRLISASFGPEEGGGGRIGFGHANCDGSCGGGGAWRSSVRGELSLVVVKAEEVK